MCTCCCLAGSGSGLRSTSHFPGHGVSGTANPSSINKEESGSGGTNHALCPSRPPLAERGRGSESSRRRKRRWDAGPCFWKPGPAASPASAGPGGRCGPGGRRTSPRTRQKGAVCLPCRGRPSGPSSSQETQEDLPARMRQPRARHLPGQERSRFSRGLGTAGRFRGPVAFIQHRASVTGERGKRPAGPVLADPPGSGHRLLSRLLLLTTASFLTRRVRSSPLHTSGVLPGSFYL